MENLNVEFHQVKTGRYEFTLIYGESQESPWIWWKSPWVGLTVKLVSGLAMTEWQLTSLAWYVIADVQGSSMPNEETFPRRLGSGGDPQAIPLQLSPVQHQKGLFGEQKGQEGSWSGQQQQWAFAQDQDGWRGRVMAWVRALLWFLLFCYAF